MLLPIETNNAFIDEFWKIAGEADKVSPPKGLKKDVKLYSHQEKAVEKGLKNGSILLSHGTGSGKTLSALATFEKMRDQGSADKALIVTPASLRVNFVDNGVRKFTNGHVAMIGNQDEVNKGIARSLDDPDPKARYHVVSYEMFMKDPEKVLKNTGADTVIYDELHRIRNEEGVTYKKLREARKLHKNFIGLTGSLMNNTPADLVPLVDAMTDGKHRLGTKQQFERRFVKDNPKTKEKTISNPFMVRSLLNPFVDHFETRDMQDERMPKKVVEEVKVMMSPYQEELYRYAINKMDPVTAVKFRLGATKLKKNDIQNIFSQITQARQVSNALHTLDLDMGLEESAKQSPKVKQLLDDLEDHIKETSDAQVVVHSNLIRGGVDVLSEGLKQRNIPFGVFVGKGQPGITEEKRQYAVKEFNEGKNKVLVISSAGGEGLDLKNATMFSSLDGHFNPEKVQQAEARAIRAGGLAHRKPEDRKVIVKRYQSVVPRSITQTAKDLMNLVSPSSMLNRLTEPSTPLFYNPFRRETSPDEWMAGVANSKDVLNESFRSELRKHSHANWYVNAEQELDQAEAALLKVASHISFSEELCKLAGSSAVGRIPFQPHRFVKSDSHIMKKYWDEFGSEIEKMEDPQEEEISDSSKLIKEQEFIDALRTYYREAAKSSGGTTTKRGPKTDAQVLKQIGLGTLGMGALGGLWGAGRYFASPERARGLKPGLIVAGLTATGAGTAAALLGLNSYNKHPLFTVPKSKARRAAKFSDNQLRSLLRGLPVVQEQVKRTDHFIDAT